MTLHIYQRPVNNCGMADIYCISCLIRQLLGAYHSLGWHQHLSASNQTVDSCQHPNVASHLIT